MLAGLSKSHILSMPPSFCPNAGSAAPRAINNPPVTANPANFKAMCFSSVD